MNITGIVAEYNPLHNGHLKHLELCRKFAGSDAIVAVLSGNFVQRGEPAVLDKWTRAALAINNGVDLVIELPVVYSVSSAEFFAFGAVNILNSLGVINNLCFGSENDEIEKMIRIAEILIEEPLQYKSSLKSFLDAGNNFSTARNLALNEYLLTDISDVINNSNNILGIEYCKSILRLKSRIMPLAVKREGSSYNEKDLSCLSSASSIRKYIETNDNIEELIKHMPEDAYSEINKLKSKNSIVNRDNMLPFLKYKCYTDKESMCRIPDVAEGIEQRIYKSIDKFEGFEELVREIKTKRYAYSRISRILCQYFIGFDFYDTDKLRKSCPAYARILGFNKKGAGILRNAGKYSSIPLVTKVKKGMFESLDLDIQATNIYSLLNSEVKFNEDFYKGPVIL